jgi:hypothetical protein
VCNRHNHLLPCVLASGLCPPSRLWPCPPRYLRRRLLLPLASLHPFRPHPPNVHGRGGAPTPSVSRRPQPPLQPLLMNPLQPANLNLGIAPPPPLPTVSHRAPPPAPSPALPTSSLSSPPPCHPLLRPVTSPLPQSDLANTPNPRGRGPCDPHDRCTVEFPM